MTNNQGVAGRDDHILTAEDKIELYLRRANKLLENIFGYGSHNIINIIEVAKMLQLEGKNE